MSDQAGEPGAGRAHAPPWEPAEPPPWEVAMAAGAELGERPVWDPGRSSLTWVDINAGRLHRYTPGDGDQVVLELSAGGRPTAIGAAAHRSAGGYVLAAADGFRLVGPDGAAESGPWRPPGMPDDVRFNDRHVGWRRGAALCPIRAGCWQASRCRYPGRPVRPSGGPASGTCT